MVRFKNRWLLAELIFPDDLVSILGATPSASQLVGSAVNLPSSQDQGDTVVDADALALPLEFYPARPAFMVPTPASTSARGLVLSGSGAAAAGAQTSKGKLGPVKEKDIWFAVKETVIAVFGDAGWALVGSSFNVRYYSPTTHLAIVRVAREHVRTLWGGLTFVRSIGGRRAVVRVVASSGTIKKAQHAAIHHSRRVTGVYLAHALASLPGADGGGGGSAQTKAHERETAAWEARRATIEEELGRMED